MSPEVFSFFIVLSLVWFCLYWVLGGVFFAALTVLRLGRLRKVRFSCLFSLLALSVGVGAAYGGIFSSQDAVQDCLSHATTQTEKVVAIFGCGAASIFGMFLLGGLVLTIGGFFFMAISKSHHKPWIEFEREVLTDQTSSQDQGADQKKSRFF
jgi:hypothetical protein